MLITVNRYETCNIRATYNKRSTVTGSNIKKNRTGGARCIKTYAPLLVRLGISSVRILGASFRNWGREDKNRRTDFEKSV